MVSRRLLLLSVAALLCAAALFAVGVLLFGHLGPTEAHILQTTACLGGAGLLAVPAVVLGEQRRHRAVARANALAAAAAGALGTASIWHPGDVQGRLAGTAFVLAVATTQAGGLLARLARPERAVVLRLFAASVATESLLGAMIVTAIWVEPSSALYARVAGAVAVLDVLFVALQPLLARLRPPARHYRLRLTLESGGTPVHELDAADVAAAAARAIRDEERRGAHVTGLRVEEERTATR